MKYLKVILRACKWTMLTLFIAFGIALIGEFFFNLISTQSIPENQDFIKTIAEPEKLFEFSWVILSALFVEFYLVLNKSTKTRLDATITIGIVLLILFSTVENSVHKFEYTNKQRALLQDYTNKQRETLNQEIDSVKYVQQIKSSLENKKTTLPNLDFIEQDSLQKATDVNQLYDSLLILPDKEPAAINLKTSWISFGWITIILTIFVSIIVRVRISFIENLA